MGVGEPVKVLYGEFAESEVLMANPYTQLDRVIKAQEFLGSASPEFLMVMDEISGLFDKAFKLSGETRAQMTLIFLVYFGEGETAENEAE